MVVFVIAYLLCIVATVVTASPTPVDGHRSCATIYPSLLQVIKSSQPDKSFDNTAPTHFEGDGALTLEQDQTNANEPLRTLQYIDFEVPHGPDVWGCQLHVADKTQGLTWTNMTDGQRGPAINVIALEPNCNHDNVTYNNIIKADPSIISARFFGYFALSPGGHSTINAESCPALTSDGRNGHLAFVFEYEYPTWQGNMVWTLPQKVPGQVGVADGNVSGVYMSYGDCWT